MVTSRCSLRSQWLAILMCSLAAPAAAQEFDIPQGLASDGADLASAMAGLAKTVIAQQRSTAAPDQTLRFRAQIVAGDYPQALAVLEQLRAPLQAQSSPRVRARYLDYVLYARSILATREKKTSFDAAYRSAFRALIEPLDDRTAAIVVNGLSYDTISEAERSLAQDLDALKGKHTLPLAAAIKLIRDYADREIHRAFGPTTPELMAEDDSHRYVTEKDVRVAMSDGGTVCALIVRPAGPTRLAALLQFTIYNDAAAILREARRAASNGYVGVIGLTRGKGCSPDRIVPYEHDGADGAALIDWIAAQPWSDGRVGMYGGSYSGFTSWAAAKYQPKALKAIMVGAPVAPGIDAPMEGNVFWNFIYPWPFYTTNNKTLDNATYNDSARWTRLSNTWYTSGRAYRDLDQIDGTPNPIFDRWINHPAYDEYWQSLIPYKEEFANISIPVLETAGYYYGGPAGAVYYLSQHYKYRPDAQHYLVIGPYDHFMAQRGTATADGDTDTISGYQMDPAALIDFSELRYQWFDYVLKGAPKPAILSSRINYEVTGANLWKHAASFAAMAQKTLRFYLAADASGAHRLSTTRLTNASSHQTVDLADRHDVAIETPGGGVEDKDLDATNGVVFVSEPLAAATETSGLFSGRLEFIANKKDFDFQIALYELTPAGDYIQLAPYWSRASFVADPTRRHELVPGRRAVLSFRSMRLMSRMLAARSRVVAVLSILREPGREINYGSGKEVSRESIADAKSPLEITWLAASYLELPAS